MPRPSVRWDRQSGRFRGANGAFVAEAKVRADLDAALANAERDMRALAEQLRTRQISLPKWELEMRSLMKDVHLGAAYVAKGGRDQMSKADFGRVGRTLRDQYNFLAKFRVDILKGYALDGHFLQRVGLYAQAGRGATFEGIRRDEEALRGRTERRNVLHAAESCLGPGSCVEQTSFGWMATDDERAIEIGSRLCKTRCRCTWTYRAVRARAA